MRPKDKVVIKDLRDEKCHECVVLKVDGNDIKVHYDGWSSSKDEWLNVNSDRVVSNSENVTVWKRTHGVVHAVGATTASPSPVDGRSARGADAESADGRVETDEESDYAEAEETVAEEDGSAHSPLEAAVVEPVSAPIRPADGAARQCALCSCPISGRIVVCEGCGSPFHAETRCLGVDDAVIAALLDGQGCIAYKCCKCRGRATRTEGAQGIDFGMLNQLLSIVGELAHTVAELKKPQNPQINLPNSNPPVRPNQTSILGDVRELYEREKRKASIVIRGIVTDNAEEILDSFDRICEFLGLDVVQLTDVVRVGSSVWRGNIADPVQRFRILSEAKRLKQSRDFSRVYVQKNLTFRQRAELMAKRAQRNGVDSSSVEVSSNDPASDDAHHNSDVGLVQDGLNQVNSGEGGSGNEGSDQGGSDHGDVGRVGSGHDGSGRGGSGRGGSDRGGPGRGASDRGASGRGGSGRGGPGRDSSGRGGAGRGGSGRGGSGRPGSGRGGQGRDRGSRGGGGHSRGGSGFAANHIRRNF